MQDRSNLQKSEQKKCDHILNRILSLGIFLAVIVSLVLAIITLNR